VVYIVGEVNGARGGRSGRTVNASLTKLDPGFRTVGVVARDQNGTSVAGATVYLWLEDYGSHSVTGSPFSVGAQVTVPDNMTLYTGVNLNAVKGPVRAVGIGSGVTELEGKVWKATAVCHDQNGTVVSNGKVGTYQTDWGGYPVTGSPFAHGADVLVPRGCQVYIYAILDNLKGPIVQKTFDTGLTEADPGFQKVTIQCRDSGGNVVTDGTTQLQSVGTEYYADGSTVTVPKDETISTRSRRLNLYADTFDATVFSNSLATFNGKFMNVVFRALDAGGALISGATIDIYTSGIAQFANGTNQILPYPDTIRVRVWKAGVVIKDVSNVAVTSQIAVSKVELAGGIAIEKGVLDIATDWTEGQQVAALAQTETALKDDFSTGDLAGWVVKGGTWSAETGVLVKETSVAAVDGEGAGLAAPDVDEENSVVSENPVDLEGYTLKVAARAEGDGSIGVTFAETDDGNCLRLVWNTDGMVLEKVEGGVATTIASNSFALELGGTYDLAASVASGQLTVSVDGDAVLTTDIGTAVGKVGLYTSGNGVAVFDDVTVEKPVVPADNGGQTPSDNGTPDSGGNGNTTPDTTASGAGSGGSGGCFIGVCRTSVRTVER
jgi:hypothetical protein